MKAEQNDKIQAEPSPTIRRCSPVFVPFCLVPPDPFQTRGVACLPCRRKKHVGFYLSDSYKRLRRAIVIQKCDGLKPRCTRCVRSRRQDVCVYETPTPDVLVEKAVERNSPAPTPHSIAMEKSSPQSGEWEEISRLTVRYNSISEDALAPYAGQRWWEMEDLPIVFQDYL
jgi:hypothetical protein